MMQLTGRDIWAIVICKVTIVIVPGYGQCININFVLGYKDS